MTDTPHDPAFHDPAAEAPAMNRIDGRRPDAPRGAVPGRHGVGVRTEVLVNAGQLDVLAVANGARPLRDRALVVEYWYPAPAFGPHGASYQTLLRDGVTPITMHGRAWRDAPAAAGEYPLVILSHGYPGNRMLLAHFGEHLASHGYRVASIDHADSTYGDPVYRAGEAFASTLYHRPLDTAFVARHFGGDYAIIGYSMGGYGALVSGGAGVARAAVEFDWCPRERLLERFVSPEVPARLKAILPIGPWGRREGLWDRESTAGLKVPMFMMAGSADDVSGYEAGMRLLFEEATGVQRHLLTFEGAAHNAAAPHPAPKEAYEPSPHFEFPPVEHYADPVWDTVLMNAIAQHYALAFLDLHLKGDAARAGWLNGPPTAPTPGPNWGLRLESRAAGPS